MNMPTVQQLLAEQLIDVRQAALIFNLPPYWLSQAQERRRRGIPHYRIGKLVRFKASELQAWMQAQHTEQGEGAHA